MRTNPFQGIRANPAATEVFAALFLLFLLCGLFVHSIMPFGPPEACAVAPPAEEIREPVIAGTWYPKDPETLSRLIEGFLGKASTPDIPGRLVALIAPHAGYVFSGQVAAHAYKALQTRKFDTVVVIAPSHRAAFSGISVYDKGGFRTPLGVAPLDRDLIAALKKRDSRIRFVPEAHEKEHSLEIQLPFLQTVAPGFKLVPLLMGENDPESCRRLAEALNDCIRGKSTLVVASSDLSHFHKYDQAKALDKVVIDRVDSFDPQGLAEDLAQGKCEACGGAPMVTAMLFARMQGAVAGKVLNYANSGDVTGDRDRVVGYLAAAFWEGTSREAAGGSESNKAGVDPGLTPEEKRVLKEVVKTTIEDHFKNKKTTLKAPVTPTLKEPRGAFVTIHKRKELRGCIGYITAVRPLIDAVAEMASAAAFRDPRFPPVTADELPELEYEISVLTPLRRIDDVESIRIGVHGIYMKSGGAAGLLLPQVAVEHGWDRAAFLEHTCRKAGLPKDAWKEKSTEIYVFSADIF